MIFSRRALAHSVVGLALVACTSASPTLASDETVDQKCVVSIERIWSRPDHAAFTDIILHNGSLYCTFREGSGHIPGLNGTVRVLRSRDRMNWESVALLEEPHVDLRDPKISITSDGRLLLNMGASYYHGSKRIGIESRVAFSNSDGGQFGAPQKVVFPKNLITGQDWMWRVTWHKGQAWACVQQVPTEAGGRRRLRLVRSDDGIHYQEVTEIEVANPSETTLRFLPDETLVAMIRCEGKPAVGRIGTARAPYTDWKIVDSNKRFGGPNFVSLAGGAYLAGTRAYDDGPAKTQLGWLDLHTARFDPLLTLPSGGDNSYPGFAIDQERGLLYVSYYSSHQDRTSIYLATLRLDALHAATAK